MTSATDSGAPLAPVDRAVRIWLRVAPGRVIWGATWAAACGGIAALPWSGWGSVARLAVAWLAAATLLGAFWSPALGGAVDVPTARDEVDAGGRTAPVGVLGARGLVGLVPPLSPFQLQRGLALGLALVVAAVLGWPVVAAVALGAVVTVVRLPGAVLGPVGLRRTVLEIAVPATAAWLALAGPQAVPAATAARGGAAAAAQWLEANVGFLGVLAAFVVVHYGTTAVRGPEDVVSRVNQVAAGYLLATAVLASMSSPLAAGAVAMLFALQWPHLALYRRGRVHWHLQSTQPMAMAAMAAAFAGVAVG